MHVVGLHGFGGSGRELADLASQLSPKKVWTPDLFANSPLSPRQSFAAWTENFLRELRQQTQGERANAVGYSLGGRLLLHAVVAAPEMFERVVIVSSHTGLTDPKEVATRRQWEQAWAQRFRELPWLEVWEQWNALEVLGHSQAREALPESAELRELLAQALVNWSPTHHTFDEANLRQLDRPVLWVAGERDQKYVDLYRLGFANGTLGQVKIIPGAGHRVHLDMPDHLLEVVSRFFQS
jgi:2-succinyl-6-hydroxy-2,4-cyclohexadiene-1-carboxylate synthase